MRPLLVVDPQPCHGQRLQLGDRLKEMGVEHLRAITPVEPLDVGILVGLARLDVVDRHPVVGAPVDERLREKFRPVVRPQGRRAAVDGHEFVEHPDDALTGHRQAHRDLQALPIPFVDDRRQQPDTSAVVERLAHEVERPGAVQSRRRGQRLSSPARQIQAQRAVHAVHVLVVPRPAFHA